MILHGRIHKLGRDIDTDLIIAGRYLNTTEMKALSAHCMEDLDPEFVKRVQPGDMVFAGENFGCGSSREHAPLVLKEIGIHCIVAKSFGRIFYRNSINVGLPILICAEAVDSAEEGGRADVDVHEGRIRLGNKEFQAQPFPTFLREIINLGGLMPYVKERLRQ